MLEPPFDIVQCSWPRPVDQREGRWISEPEWDAPAMPFRPQPGWTRTDGALCWTIDWCAHFRGGLKFWEAGQGGEMRGFHVVFHVRVRRTGTLEFWDDDGSILRRDGEVLHVDRGLHPPTRSEVQVEAGDRLEVAQWQCYGGWTWGARIAGEETGDADAMAALSLHLEAVCRRLKDPGGPPLKMYCGGGTPLRTVLALYSMILNGYSPAEVLVFGEYQWSPRSRAVFEALLPFARIVPTDAVLEVAGGLGGSSLVCLVQQCWAAMKLCIGLLYPPHTYALMDDDVFMLERVDDALHALERHRLVHAPDADYGAVYRKTWGAALGRAAPLPTGRVNTGLYWASSPFDPQQLARDLLRLRPGALPVWQWEQGFVAVAFAGEPVHALAGQRYFYPYFDGLPGGVLGYDYANNPCGFASIHFGGLAEKPGDVEAMALAPYILERRR